MLRLLSVPALLLAGAALVSTGCRACSTCHDYDPPVPCDQCGTCCGCHRAGSAFGGCGCGPGCTPPASGFVEGAPVEGEYIEGEAPEGEVMMGQRSGPSPRGGCPCNSGN